MFIVGIVGRAYQNKDGQNIIQTHESIRKFLMSKDNVVCITLLPTDDVDYYQIESGDDKVNSIKLDYILSRCDAFVVPGGTYGYSFDEYVIRYAIDHNKPLLAICLGFQILCSMFAKDRTKFDMTRSLGNDSHYGDSTQYIHKVKVMNDTLLDNILKQEMVDVNSVHHDVVDFEMEDLLVSAISEDGIIEGVEYPNKRFILGLQWHPEYLLDDNSYLILEHFVEAIRH